MKNFDERLLELEENYKQIVMAFCEYKENIKKRDYLIRTYFLGSLTDRTLMYGFMDEIFSDPLIVSCNLIFIDVKHEILDYDFSNIDYFYDKLKEYEEKQNILDKYTSEVKCE